MSRRTALAGCGLAIAMLCACTGGSSGGTSGGTAATSGGNGGGGKASSTAGGPSPAWQQDATYYAANGDAPIKAHLAVYPLTRVGEALLLTVDLTPAGTEDVFNSDYFCGAPNACATLRGVSLIDTTNRVRYGPLTRGDDHAVPFASKQPSLDLTPGVTYRYGAFFPAPEAGVTALSVDLQQGGVAPGVPIADGGPAAGLVVPAGTGDVPTPSEPAAGQVMTLPVAQPSPDAFVDKHDLVAKVVGGTVTQGGNRRQGIVSLNADVLFAFDSSTLASGAAGLVAKAAEMIDKNADPAAPVQVVGYTDDKGSSDYNLTLSRSRAEAVAKALTGKVGGRALKVSWRGEADPVAPNTSGGADNPAGRALNRRVEIRYVPRPAPGGSTAAAPGVEGSAPVASPSAGTEGQPSAAGPRPVAGSGVETVPMSAAVHPIVRDGSLTLVRVDLTPQAKVLGSDAFSSHQRGDLDTGAFEIVDPASKRVYIPAFDADDEVRLAATVMPAMNAGTTTHLWFYTALLPAGMTSATVDLGQLGRVASVPVGR